jgi:hypothetical protein
MTRDEALRLLGLTASDAEGVVEAAFEQRRATLAQCIAAAATPSLREKYVVRLFDVHHTGGLTFLIMELLKGRSPRRSLRLSHGETSSPEEILAPSPLPGHARIRNNGVAPSTLR